MQDERQFCDGLGLYLKQAFYDDDMPKKNIALRKAYDALSRQQAENERLREALGDLISWFPEKPSEPEWRIRAGERGADDAVEAARAALDTHQQENDDAR